MIPALSNTDQDLRSQPSAPLGLLVGGSLSRAVSLVADGHGHEGPLPIFATVFALDPLLVLLTVGHGGAFECASLLI